MSDANLARRLWQYVDLQFAGCNEGGGGLGCRKARCLQLTAVSHGNVAGLGQVNRQLHAEIQVVLQRKDKAGGVFVLGAGDNQLGLQLFAV